MASVCGWTAAQPLRMDAPRWHGLPRGAAAPCRRCPPSLCVPQQPVGVGYSFEESPGGVQGDYSAVSDMLAAMVLFFEKHPERSQNTIYIASESYGGHYMPSLALALLTGIQGGADQANFYSSPLYNITRRFGGILVGNPYVNFASGEVSGVSTAWGFQVIPKPLWQRFKNSGCDDLTADPFQYSDDCWKLLNAVNQQIQSGGGFLSSSIARELNIENIHTANSSLGSGGLNACKLYLPYILIIIIENACFRCIELSDVPVW